MFNPLGLQGSVALPLSYGDFRVAGLMHFGVIAFRHVR